MTTFYRRAHSRRGKFGGITKVNGHHVTRDYFCRNPWGLVGLDSTQTYLNLNPQSNWPLSRTIPNWTCPQCGKKVFFYQNDSGSKVYFDHLGPPWPKHPCLSGGACEATISEDGQTKFEFNEFVIIDVRKIEIGHLMVATMCGQKFSEYSYFHLIDICEDIVNVKKVFLSDEKISFCDPKSLNVHTLKARKLAAAENYIHLLLGIPGNFDSFSHSIPFVRPLHPGSPKQLRLDLQK